MDKQQREYIHHLMLQYSDAMVRLTYRRVGDWHLAEDLVQEAYLTAFEKLPQLQEAENFPSWLHMIVANKCRDYLKKKKPTKKFG